MSLCVAWKYQSKYCMATDSRISGVGENPCDIGIKLLQIPLRIFTPIEQGQVRLIHSGTIGLSFSGSYLSGFLTKERVAEVLYNLQFIGSREQLNFECIVGVIEVVFTHSMKALREAKMQWDTEIIIMGQCPVSQSPKAFHVFPKDEEVTTTTEILKNPDYDYFAIGTGAEYFEIMMEEAKKQPIRVHFKTLEIISNTIRADTIKTVGGDVQYGDLDPAGNFQLLGVMHYSKDGDLIQPKASCRGVDIDELQSQNPGNLLHVIYSFIDPFNPQYKA